MDRLSRYLATQCLETFAGLSVLALGVLLLERLPRIFDLVANTSDAMGAAARMLVDITPHHLTEAVPLALFIGVLVTVDRVSRTGELAASLAAGVSLYQILKPFLIIAAGLSVVSLLLAGFLRPIAHYDFRKTRDDVRQRSVEAAFQEGKFAQAGDRIYWTQDRSGGGGELGQVFIFEREKPGQDAVLTTARRGALEPGPVEDETRVSLIDGRAITFAPNRDIVERLAFDRTDWNVGGEADPYRPRGQDFKEATLPELLAAMSEPSPISPATASAMAHATFGRAVMLLFFPLIALPFGLGHGRRFSSTGIAIGILFLVVLQKSLESGQTLAMSGAIPGWAGTWPVVALVGLGGLWLFLRSALRVSTPPLMALETGLFAPLSRLFQRLAERLRPPAGA